MKNKTNPNGKQINYVARKTRKKKQELKQFRKKLRKNLRFIWSQ